MTDPELEALAAKRYDEEVRRVCLDRALATMRLDDREFLSTALTRAFAFYGFITVARPDERVLH